ncbi:2,4-dienoyl-CoA reductase [Natronoarchaeum philippinense]|uniref:2,4-dienoyl-CoA reductase n=1 Tax=Natronoarchaeum philippinense TaxID=558529 RepID=A0A285NZN9_NATPI|nr:NADH-dependent flavin oxidoreductase [Natronoarchaeum philippinense]SNZ14930.1 2,4-dienoyl-CoA reductase [Natronoarchaeum philippinense]
MARLEAPVGIGDRTLQNRLYRAPLLECAGNGPEAVDALIEDLEPAAASGAGLLCQGATIVRGEGGCAAPGMTRVHDPEFVEQLARLTERVHDHGAKIAIQLEHGGLRSMEVWHAGYRQSHSGLEQLAVSRPPWQLRALDRLGLVSFDPHVLDTAEVYGLAADFGKAAARAVDAGYDAIHLAGANMGVVQQFLSPFYNRRDDEFGGSRRERVRFLELVHDEIRARAGDVPLLTKVPAETAAPRLVQRHLDLDDGVWIAEHLADYGYDAVAPVRANVTWDMSIVRGEYPGRAWEREEFADGYADAFGSRYRARAVAALNRLQARRFEFEPAWNESFCRRVRRRVDVPVMLEGGVRERGQMDRLLGATGEEPACDLVGMARPFYAEPRLPARLLDAEAHSASSPRSQAHEDAEEQYSSSPRSQAHEDAETRAVCESCNNCTVPQVTGAPGVCRTPSVLRRRGELEKQGAYERDADD